MEMVQKPRYSVFGGHLQGESSNLESFVSYHDHYDGALKAAKDSLGKYDCVQVWDEHLGKLLWMDCRKA